jgi:RHS repeat-associated protein
LKFVYDGWNLIAILTSEFSLQTSFSWGLDLSGSNQGAGGVGGLLAATLSGQGTHFIAYDGNGNVMALVSASGGTVTAQYEYSPFGETLAASGSAANANAFRFSTKYTDAESGFLYYGYRFYNPSTGRWLSRDPIGERGGKNNYAFACNDSINGVDVLGLHQFTLKKNPGRIEKPRPLPGVPDELMGGETTFWLLDREWVEKVKGEWYVRGKGESTIGFWYSSPESETHELHHVSDDESVWNEFVSEADPYIDKPFCSKKKAECFREVVEKLGTLYRSRAEQRAAQFDCDEYDRAKGGKLGRCALAAKLKPENDAYAIAIGKKILDCEAMK